LNPGAPSRRFVPLRPLLFREPFETDDFVFASQRSIYCTWTALIFVATRSWSARPSCGSSSRRGGAVVYVDHDAHYGCALFEEICRRDLEGIIATYARGAYDPDAARWYKIKNPAYSQMAERWELLQRRTVSSFTLQA
jgi:hypothetical protein